MLLKVTEEAWKEIVHHRAKQRYRNLRRRMEQLTPKFTETTESARFHLRLLAMYQQAPFCPVNVHRWPSEYMHAGYAPMPSPYYPPMYYPPGGPQGPSPNQPITLKTDANERAAFMMNGMRMAPPPMMNFNGYPHPHHLPPRPGMPKPPTDALNGQQQVPKRDTNSLNDGEKGRVDYGKSLESELSLFESYRLVQCECEGRLTEEKDVFICKSCDFAYHYDCIKIEDRDGADLCPLCVLRKPTMMSEMLGYPLMTAWHKTHDDFQFKLSRQHSESIRKAKMEGMTCLLRFLKVNRPTHGTEKGFGVSSEVVIP